MKHPVLTPETLPANVDPPLGLEHVTSADDSPDSFILPLLSCFKLVGRALLVLLGGCLMLDLASVSAGLHAPSPVWVGLALLAAGLITAAVVMLGSIQVQYTFEHAHMHRRHFYALKLARFREACAALQSFALADAVPAVHALQDLRRQTGMLDRRLAIETLMLRRRWRDLTWFPRAGVAAGCGAAAFEMVEAGSLDAESLGVPGALLAAGLLAWIAIERWAADRVAHIRELLGPAPAELSAAFNPSPPMEALVERLLTRINHHFDRLRGVAGLRFDTVEEEAGA